MSDMAIRVEGLSKRYRIGARQERYYTLRDTLTETVARPFQKLASFFSRNGADLATPDASSIWALRYVSFEVKRGEAVGIIGRNGAGKSTLLKILSRITEPTEGRARIHGRVGSLLEVGTGFHSELTGRENIYLNGAILGMKKSEIDRKFDEIMAFAEVEQFIDTPVKHYSSGMYLRLAFAVAAHLEPEILIVDEVLAVGDAAFQKKCIGKMGEVAREGRTVLFVSHNMGAVARLCARSLWVEKGRIVLQGSTNEVVSQYQSQHLVPCSEWKRPTEETSEATFAFLNVAVRDSLGRLASLFRGDEPVSVEIQYQVNRLLSGCQIGVRLYNSDGLVIFTTADSDSSCVSAMAKEPGKYRALFSIPGHFLAQGRYFLLLAGHLPNRNVYEVIEHAVAFEVSPSGCLASLDGRLGITSPLLHWETFADRVA